MTKFYRAFRTSLQYIYRNFGLSFASIIVMTLSFFIVSIVGIAFYGSLKLVKYIDSKPALTVFLRGDLTKEQAQQFTTLVNSTGLVREFTINDINFSKDDLNRKYPELQGTITDENKVVLPTITFIYGKSQNDLKNLISILEKNQNFMQNLVDHKNIETVGWYQFNSEQADVIRDANRLLRTSGIGITAFLFVISSILIFITIRLTIYYHRKELEIMDLVGADSWFIKLPFVIDGMIYGIVGGLLSTLVIFLFKNFVIKRSQDLIPRLNSFFAEITWPKIDGLLMLEIILITCILGALVGSISSLFAIFRYVKKQ